MGVAAIVAVSWALLTHAALQYESKPYGELLHNALDVLAYHLVGVPGHDQLPRPTLRLLSCAYLLAVPTLVVAGWAISGLGGESAEKESPKAIRQDGFWIVTEVYSSRQAAVERKGPLSASIQHLSGKGTLR